MTPTDRPCPDDLFARGRRNELSQIERRALDAHVGQCASCRAASAVATLFDAIPDVQPGDELLIARVAGRATRVSRGGFAQRWMQVAAAGIVVLVGGAATATWLTLKRHEAEHQKAESPSPSVSPRKHVVKSSSGPAPAGDLADLAADAVEAPALSPRGVASARPEAHERHPTSRSMVQGPQQTGAASLFAEANAVRRAGELRRAVGLYQSLRQQFPESSQALLASLSIGDLLFGLGDPAGAFAAYDSYLNHFPAGALTEEALFGRARCLARLGRTAEERQTWEELVLRYPRSVYRPAANRRLEELGR
jgi:TolA-binding protein